MENQKKKKANLGGKESGITLVALVVTIVVLLILAGITIVYVLGDNGIFKLAQDAKNKTEEAIQNEQDDFNNLKDYMDEALGKVEIPEGLEVGSTVTYNPSGSYKWLHKYCSSTKAEKAEDGTTDAYDLLESGTGKSFEISEWKVLSIDEATGKVELVPSSPTTGAVYLGQAQGYNNGVKLLNDACSNLYGNNQKGITARSINIEDIEKYMTQEALTGTNGAHNYVETNSNTKYGNQVSNAYTSSKSYPFIYAKEKKAFINGSTPTDATLDLSDTLDRFIERSEGTSTTANIGAITTATSIQPYLTYWYKNATSMQTAFLEYTKKDNTKVKYYDLIIPQGTATSFWMASRCVYPNSGSCAFVLSNVDTGSVSSCITYTSVTLASNNSLPLFPVVTLSSKLVKPETDGTFAVNLE